MFIKTFEKLGNNDADTAGGKGASLGKMTRAGIPVPFGFVVLASAFERFLEETDLNVEIDAILHTVNHKEMHTVENASEKIQALILDAPMPKDIASAIMEGFSALGGSASGGKKLGVKFVAVRSSATAEDSASAAWAGQLDSFLNTTEQDLLKNVQRCWASLFTPRAIFYRFELHDKNRAHGTEAEQERGRHTELEKVSVAVVVQKMVESDVSGIAFSVHPVTEDRNQMIIEVGFGLGEAIVSGQITPDSYVVEKQPRRIIDKNVSVQERGLYRASLYPSKVKPEASVQNKWVEIPKEKGAGQKLSDKQIFELSELILKIEKHYGFPCDIEWAFAGGKFYILQSRPITTLTQEKKSDGQNQLGPFGFVSAEWQLEFQQRDSHPPLVADLWLRSLRGHLDKELRIPINPPDYLFTGTSKGYIKSKNKKEILRKFREATEDEKYLYYVFERTMGAVEEFDSIANTILSSLKNNQARLQKLWNQYEKKILEVIPWFYIPWYLTEGNIISDKVRAGLEKHRKEIEQITDFNNALGILLFPIKEADFQREQNAFYQLVEIAKSESNYKNLSKFKEKADQYLQKFAWMKTFLILPIEPRTHEELLQNVEDAVKKNGFEEYSLQQEKKKENKKLADRLKTIFAQDKTLLKSIEHAQELGWLLTASVEKAFYAGYKLIPFYKKIALALGIPYESLVYLKAEEIQRALEGKEKVNSQILSERKVSYVALMTGRQIAWIFGEMARDATNYIDTHVDAVDENINSFSGQPAYPGKVTGQVCVVFSPAEAKKLQEGQILVTSMTSPDYVPAMRRASAIVTNEGGLLSHAAIASRELGKPCIVGTKVATKVLKDGDLVEVDADRGVVTILKKANEVRRRLFV